MIAPASVWLLFSADATFWVSFSYVESNAVTCSVRVAFLSSNQLLIGEKMWNRWVRVRPSYRCLSMVHVRAAVGHPEIRPCAPDLILSTNTISGLSVRSCHSSFSSSFAGSLPFASSIALLSWRTLRILRISIYHLG